MKAVNNKVLVRVDMRQKDCMIIGDTIVKTAWGFGTNYRERSPVVCQFAEKTKLFRKGDIAICHHNNFYDPSPYHLEGDLFSVPVNKTIFGVLDSEGNMTPVMGNMICKTIPVPSLLPLPRDQQKDFINRYEIVEPGWTHYKKGQIIFTRPYSGYLIVYTWGFEERRVLKVDSDMVCGILTN